MQVGAGGATADVPRAAITVVFVDVQAKGGGDVAVAQRGEALRGLRLAMNDGRVAVMQQVRIKTEPLILFQPAW